MNVIPMTRELRIGFGLARLEDYRCLVKIKKDFLGNF
jgi:hypothetical protein